MMRNRLGKVFAGAAAALAVITCGQAAQAQLVFYTDSTVFTNAMTAANSAFIGTENFEQSTQAANLLTTLSNPLTQGVANGSFPTGLTQPLTIQTNTLGANATTVSPGTAAEALVALSAGRFGAPSDVVVNNRFGESMDYIFSSATQLGGFGFNPYAVSDGSIMQVQVYDTANTLLGSTTITANQAQNTFLGIQATNSNPIGRINLFTTFGGSNGNGGADNIQLYKQGIANVPEPGTVALAASGLLPLGTLLMRKRRNRKA